MTIISKEYEISDKNYFKTKTKKNRIIIGGTQTVDMSFINGWRHRWGGNYKKTQHFTITPTGKIYQHFPIEYFSKFTGIPEIDHETISIGLVNLTWLMKDHINNVWLDPLGFKVDINENSVVKRNWRDRTYWVKYNLRQIRKLSELINKLCIEGNIEKNIINHNTYIKDKKEFWTVSVRPNYLYYSTDIGASFPFKELIDYGSL